MDAPTTPYPRPTRGSPRPPASLLLLRAGPAAEQALDALADVQAAAVVLVAHGLRGLAVRLGLALRRHLDGLRTAARARQHPGRQAGRLENSETQDLPRPEAPRHPPEHEGCEQRKRGSDGGQARGHCLDAQARSSTCARMMCVSEARPMLLARLGRGSGCASPERPRAAPAWCASHGACTRAGRRRRSRATCAAAPLALPPAAPPPGRPAQRASSHMTPARSHTRVGLPPRTARSGRAAARRRRAVPGATPASCAQPGARLRHGPAELL